MFNLSLFPQPAVNAASCYIRSLKIAGDKAAIFCSSLSSSVQRSNSAGAKAFAARTGRAAQTIAAQSSIGVMNVTRQTIGWLNATAIPSAQAAWGSLRVKVGELACEYAVWKRIRFMKAKALRTTEISGHTGVIIKRSIDIAAASFALLLLSPVFLVIAIWINRSMGGPVFYAHPRIGRGGRVFNCYKFRSMVQNSAQVLESYLAENPHAQREWSATRKLRNDPRVTPLGQFLRRSSIDELPQLFNVLRGEMSLVGPRPVVASELELYKPYTAEYIAMRPGITGLWQVSGRSNTSYTRRVELDRYYARRWSVGLDIDILLRTLPALARTNETD